MNVYLRGHSLRYAAEQAALCFFPAEKPAFPGGEAPRAGEDAWLVSSLYEESARAEARVLLYGREAAGEASLSEPLPEAPLLRKRAAQRLVKLAVFRAAVAHSGETPPWGALTGVRPGKLAARFIAETGADRAAAAAFLERDYFVSPARAALCADAAAAGLEAASRLAENEISLYVGIPFCPSRCAYCSFVSQTVERSFGLIPPYVEALRREIAEVGAVAGELGLRVSAVYFGGGTPTTLSAEQLRGVMEALAAAFDLSACREYTVEAGRPDTITREKLLALVEGGATRISVNPQSMDDRVLAAIGRRHTAAETLAAVALAREVFPGALNMDLIAGLPGDTEAGFRGSLAALLALAPENITVHCLTRKRGAALNTRSGGPAVPEGPAVGRMLDEANAALRGGGYAPYYLYRQKHAAGGFENVGWTKPGAACLYNICMMEEVHTVLSLGAGGVSKRVERATGKVTRASNPKYPQEYLRAAGASAEDKRRLLTL